MKKIKKISIFIAVFLMISMLFSVCVFASTTSEAPDSLRDVNGGDLDIMDRVEYALQGTATGMLMIFGVLALLAIVVSLSKVVLHDIPQKARKAALEEQKKQEEAENAPVAFEPAPTPAVSASAEDDGQLIAVITAAVAAAIESGEYKEQFASGFRVVSFTRVNGAWDKK